MVVRRRASGKVIDGSKLAVFFGNVHLGGLLEECVLCAEGELLYVRAVDLTNSVFIYCEVSGAGLELPAKVTQLGIGNLGLLCKMLDLAKQEPITMRYSGNRLDIDRGEHGVLHYLLSDPSVIPTVVEQADAIEKLEELCTSYTALSQVWQKDFLAYAGIVASKIVFLQVEDDKLVLVGGTSTEHQFRLVVGDVLPLKKRKPVGEAFRLAIYGDHLKAVLQALEFTVQSATAEQGKKITFDDQAPEFWYSEGKPLLVRSKANVWALVPVEMTEGE